MNNAQTARRAQHGFTLVELLITVAIVAILAIISMSAYASFSSRAQVAEAFTVTEGVKHAYNVEYATNGHEATMTLVELDSGWTPQGFQGQYVEAVDITNGFIRVNFKADIGAPLQGTSLYMTPFETENGVLIWQCGKAPAPTDASAIPLLPAGTAAGGVVASDATPAATNIPDSLLPSDCRA
jgi:type IV pilus assembly protein PilA